MWSWSAWKLVEVRFVAHHQQQQKRGGHAHAQAQRVENSKSPMAGKVTEGDFQVVFQHGGSCRVGQPLLRTYVIAQQEVKECPITLKTLCLKLNYLVIKLLDLRYCSLSDATVHYRTLGFLTIIAASSFAVCVTTISLIHSSIGREMTAPTNSGPLRHRTNLAEYVVERREKGSPQKSSVEDTFSKRTSI